MAEDCGARKQDEPNWMIQYSIYTHHELDNEVLYIETKQRSGICQTIQGHL